MISTNNIIILAGAPMPPSVNDQYASIMIAGKIRRIPSKSYAQYKKAFGFWALKNKQQILEARETIVAWNTFLSVSMIVALEKSRLLTLDGRMKQLDVSNRIKSAHDLLADSLRIDDKLFVTCAAEKVIAPDESQEQVIFVLRPQKLRALEDVFSSSF